MHCPLLPLVFMASEAPRKAGRPRNPVSRDALLAVARTAFAESGYAGASMNDIAGRAGIRKASLFHHFRSKEALYLEMFSLITQDLSRLVVEANLSEGGFVQRLDRLGSLVTHYFGDHPHVARLAMRELVDGGPFAGGAGRAQVEMALRVVVAFLRSGIEEGVIADQDPRQLAITITGLHLFHFAASDLTGSLFGGKPFAAETVAERNEAVRDQVRRLCGVQGEE